MTVTVGIMVNRLTMVGIESDHVMSLCELNMRSDWFFSSIYHFLTDTTHNFPTSSGDRPINKKNSRSKFGQITSSDKKALLSQR